MSDDEEEYEVVSPSSLPVQSPMNTLQQQLPIPARRTISYNREPSGKPPVSPPTATKLKKSPPAVPARPRSRTFPRPVPQLQKKPSLKYTSQQSNDSGKDANLDDDGEDISLEDLSIRYGDSLPIQVQVTRGIYGDDDDSTISTADSYSLHLSRHRDQVKVEDRRNREEFYIPMNSTIQFSVVYNPTHNEEAAIRGIVYPSVKELLQLKPLPRVVCITEVTKSGKIDWRLHAGEILFILEAVKSPVYRNRRQLKVYSIRDRAEKLLDETCEGHFSTKPQHLKMSLARIMRHLKDPFPLEVVLSPDAIMGSKLPSYLFSRILHMTERRSDAYFIATTLFDDADMAATAEPIEIPANLDIEVRVVPLSGEESERLKTASKDISDTVQGKYVKHYRYTNITTQQYLTQAEIYSSVSESQRRQGSVRSLSESSNHSPNDYETPRSPLLPEESVSDESDYERPNTGSRLTVEKQFELLEHRVKTFESVVSEMKLKLSSVAANVDSFRETYESLEGKIQQQSNLFESSLERMQKLQTDLESKLIQSASQKQVHPTKIDCTNAERRNVEYLTKLLPEQVLQLLDALGMDKYRDTFAREGISGDVLQECDERILEHELGVSLRIHRIRLMKLITGKHSAEGVLTGEGAKAKVYVD